MRKLRIKNTTFFVSFIHLNHLTLSHSIIKFNSNRALTTQSITPFLHKNSEQNQATNSFSHFHYFLSIFCFFFLHTVSCGLFNQITFQFQFTLFHRYGSDKSMKIENRIKKEKKMFAIKSSTTWIIYNIFTIKL